MGCWGSGSLWVPGLRYPSWLMLGKQVLRPSCHDSMGWVSPWSQILLKNVTYTCQGPLLVKQVFEINKAFLCPDMLGPGTQVPAIDSHQKSNRDRCFGVLCLTPMITKDIDTRVGEERMQTLPREEQGRLPPWRGAKEGTVRSLVERLFQNKNCS